LAEALNKGQIYAYGADVLSIEPAQADNPLLTAKNIFLTPHIAWATKEARQRLMTICAENIKAYIRKEPQNVVNR
ncbi:MAG: D-2-hydroxyacid dehydrogenase, partial [Paraprevotella sp.]|nr:D-2-hydroxyacid dehydrogenase [Paraprevotella sp.]